MATTKQPKLSSLYNSFSNPSGGSSTLLDLIKGLQVKPSSSNMTMAPNMSTVAGPVYAPAPSTAKIAAAAAAKPAPNMSTVNGPVYVPPPSAASLSAIAKGGSNIPPPAGGTGGGYVPPGLPTPTPPPAVSTPETAKIPPQWLRPDGTVKTPEEVAAEIAGTLKTVSSGADIGRLAGDQFSGAEKTPEQLATEARQISNIRNDIAVGETDPYGVASDSGIAYTPAELSAIEKAYAGIYDPALAGAMSKLEAAQQAAADETKRIQNIEAEEVKWKRELEKLAIEHNYDLVAMEKDQAFQKALVGYKASLDAKSKETGITPYSDERQQRTINSVDELIGDTNAWTTGWGSLLSMVPESEAKNYKARLNTLKASIAFNELTAMREASKTGGALGNVSNIELNLLESALGALDQAQSSEQIVAELNKIKGSINRWREAQGATAITSSSAGGGGAIPSGTDGASYGFPGYVSDGTQWVAK